MLRGKLHVYAAVFLAWTVLGVFFFSQGLAQKFVSHDPTPWWHYLATWLTGVYLCAALTPAILWLGRRFPFERKTWLRRAALHLLFSVMFSVAELAVHSAILPLLGLFPSVMKTFPVTFLMLMIIAFHQNMMMYWTILGIQYAVGYYRN